MAPYVVGAVFARGGSKGLPGKNTRLLGGKPLIAHAIAAARATALIERVIVSTDDPAIAAVAREYGAEVPFLRPAELAADEAPEWLAWQHAVRELAAMDGGRTMDVLVSVPGTACARRLSSFERKSSELIETSSARRVERRWSMQAFFAIWNIHGLNMISRSLARMLRRADMKASWTMSSARPASPTMWRT